MEVEIPFTLARSRHLREMDDIMDSLKFGKSRHSKAPAEKLRWRYSWSILHEGQTLAEILSGPPSDTKILYEEDAVQDLMRRTRVTLRGSIGHWRGVTLLTEVPPEIEAIHRQAVSRDMAEEARFAAMSPEDRRRHMAEGLAELRKDSGFAELHVRDDKVVEARVQGRKDGPR